MATKNTFITFCIALTISLLKQGPPFPGDQLVLSITLPHLPRHWAMDEIRELESFRTPMLIDKNKVQNWGKLRKANDRSSPVKIYFALRSSTACFYFSHTEDKLNGFSFSTKSKWRLSIQMWDGNFLAQKKVLLPISNQKCCCRAGISGRCSRNHGENAENYYWNS